MSGNAVTFNAAPDASGTAVFDINTSLFPKPRGGSALAPLTNSLPIDGTLVAASFSGS